MRTFREKFLVNYANISVISIWVCRRKIDNLTKEKPGSRVPDIHFFPFVSVCLRSDSQSLFTLSMLNHVPGAHVTEKNLHNNNNNNKPKCTRTLFFGSLVQKRK